MNMGTARKTRVEAVGAVVAAIRQFPGGRARAGHLEAAIAAGGVSVRQARRWIRWAAADGATHKAPKDVYGTAYFEPAAAQEGCPAILTTSLPEASFAAPHRALANVERWRRRDVGLLITGLGHLGGTATDHELRDAVACLAGRCRTWAWAALDAGTCRGLLKVMSPARASWEATWHFTDAVDIDVAKAWAESTPFRLPAQEDLEDWVRDRLRNHELVLTPGEMTVMSAIARLGGTATADELRECVRFEDRGARATIEFLRTAAWADWRRQRFHLHPDLWA